MKLLNLQYVSVFHPVHEHDHHSLYTQFCNKRWGMALPWRTGLYLDGEIADMISPVPF